MKKTLSIVFLILLCNVVYSQYPYHEDDRLRFGVQIGADYDFPLGKLGTTYKPAISSNISLLLWKNERFTANITYGYHAYQPKASEFYYLTDDGANYGVETFSEYKVKSFYIGCLYEIPITKKVKGLAGFNFGAYDTEYEKTSEDRQFTTISGGEDRNVYIGPKLGCSFNIAEYIAWNMLVKYSFFSPTGDNTNSPAAFHKELGVIYKTWSLGTGISYKF